MINFDEEIQKFQPSLEVEDAEDAIYNNDVPDITDRYHRYLAERIQISSEGWTYEML